MAAGNLDNSLLQYGAYATALFAPDQETQDIGLEQLTTLPSVPASTPTHSHADEK